MFDKVTSNDLTEEQKHSILLSTSRPVTKSKLVSKGYPSYFLKEDNPKVGELAGKDLLSMGEEDTHKGSIVPTEQINRKTKAQLKEVQKEEQDLISVGMIKTCNNKGEVVIFNI